MPELDPNRRRELRRFGAGAALALGLFALAAHSGSGPFWLFGAPPAGTSLVLGLAALWVGGVALAFPRWNQPLERGARAVARAIAFATLLVFFFGVITPFGLTARLVGYDPLQRRAKSRRDSYWRAHRSRDRSDYFHQS
jgi:hypothetical protein